MDTACEYRAEAYHRPEKNFCEKHVSGPVNDYGGPESCNSTPKGRVIVKDTIGSVVGNRLRVAPEGPPDSSSPK